MIGGGCAKKNVLSPLVLPTIGKFLPVVSGKGGVGKSFVALHLALALAKRGLKIGLLDLDIYGPSIPLMMGIKEGRREDGKLIPAIKDGLTVMSMGMLMPLEKAALWRGPIIQMAVRQLLEDTVWGELDILVIDTPPGTGDVHLSLTQILKLSAGLIVSTSQEIALVEAKKSHDMLETLGIQTLGLVVNMTSVPCSSCGHPTEMFPSFSKKDIGVRIVATLPFFQPSDAPLRDEAFATLAHTIARCV